MKKTINPELLASIAAGAALKTSDSSDIPSSPSSSSEIPLELIDYNPHQPRMGRDTELFKEHVKTLSESIKEHGLLQPITVCINGDRYTIIAGETRFEACKLLGYKTIRPNIIEASDEDLAILALIENVQRTDLHPIEIQIAISREPFLSMNDEEIAQILGFSNVTKVRNIRSISRLVQEVRDHLIEHRPSIGVDLLVELQKYPEQFQLSTYHKILSGEKNRSDLRFELQSLNEKEKFKQSQEAAKRNLYDQSTHSYFISKSDLDSKNKKAFETELSELIKKYKIR